MVIVLVEFGYLEVEVVECVVECDVGECVMIIDVLCFVVEFL